MANNAKTTNKQSKGNQSRQKVAKLTKKIRFAMLSTIDETGSIVSRPMAHQAIERGRNLWFFAEDNSRMVNQIKANPQVGVALSSKDSWVSIAGQANIVRDQKMNRKLWNAGVSAWLPQGPKDPSVVLIKVKGQSAEYWDTPGGRVASVISYAKARITHHRYDGGERAIVELADTDHRD